MANGEAIEVTLLVTEVLENLGIPYLVGGSIASSLHGFPRATQDVDLVADLLMEHIEPLVEILGQEFYIDGRMIGEAIAQKSSFNRASGKSPPVAKRKVGMKASTLPLLLCVRIFPLKFFM